jgi:hypothetical protein
MSTCDSCHKKGRVLCYDCSGRHELKAELEESRAALKRARAEALEQIADYVAMHWDQWITRAGLPEEIRRYDETHHVEGNHKLPTNSADTETESGARCPDPRAHRRKTPHSCDVPGCVTCNNPDDPTEEKEET